MSTPNQTASSQTLSRGLSALELLADAQGPLTINELAARLGLHRSITYRIVRTLEDHGLVVRRDDGALELGARLASLARNVSRDLQSAALRELTGIANDHGMTAFVAVLDSSALEAVTLVSVEPRNAAAAVAQRPGNRHSIRQGAPGRAIRGQLPGAPEPASYETSHDEVIMGLSSIAVPLPLPGYRPAAIAVVYLTQSVDIDAIAARLKRAATAIRLELD